MSVDPTHAESFNNLGVLEHRKGNEEMANANFHAAMNLQLGLYESHYNAALLSFKQGAFQESYEFVEKVTAPCISPLPSGCPASAGKCTGGDPLVATPCWYFEFHRWEQGH